MRALGSTNDRSAFLIALVALSGACAPSTKPGQGPGAQSPQASQTVSSPGGAVEGAGGQQYAISDAPTSGEAANRPKMGGSAASAYAAGMQAFQSGDLEGAKAQFTKAAESDANAYQAWYSLGVVRERLGEISGALTAYRKAVSIVRDYEPAIAAYGVLLARTQKVSEAESWLEDYQGKLPKSAAVTAALAEVKSIKGESAEAQKLAQEALKKNPDYRPAMVTIARDHYRNRRLDLAQYTLKAVLDGFGTENPPRDRNNADAYLLRGLINKEQGLRGPAITDLKRAVELRPDLVEGRVHLATYVLESGNAQEAAQLLEGALRYDKLNVLARLNLGDAYRLLGKTVEAKRELEWVAAKDPSLAQVHYNLGLLYLFSENVPGTNPKQAADRAIDEFEQYKKMRPRTTTGRDDTDELITRAKTKKGLIEAKESEKAQPAAPPAPAPAKPGATPAPAPAKPGATPAPAPAKPGAPPAPAPAKPGAPPPPSGGGSGSTGKLPPADEKKPPAKK